MKTDPAPLTMIETTIQLKPREQWRPGLTLAELKQELDALVKFPGLTNAWVMPIKTRIDMLATGIKTPVGIKVAGPDLKIIQEIGQRLEEVVQQVPGTASAYSERVAGGRYVTVDIARLSAARFGLSIKDVQEVVRTALGGMVVSQTVEGLERYPINVRYPRDLRDSLEKLRNLPVVTPTGARIPLGEVADIRVESGPAMIKSEDARLNGWTFVDIQGRDLGSYVTEAQRIVSEQVQLPAGYSINWSGQYEYLVRAKERLKIVIPITLAIIVLLLYLNFKNLIEVLIILGTLPLALVGGFWLLYWLDYNISVAVGVGFIALAGVAVEIGVVMLVYLNQAYNHQVNLAQTTGGHLTAETLREAVIEGALLRVRPIMMTVAAIIARAIADHAGQRHGFGGDATHCRPHGRRHDQCDRIDAGGDPRGIPAVETAWAVIGQVVYVIFINVTSLQSTDPTFSKRALAMRTILLFLLAAILVLLVTACATVAPVVVDPERLWQSHRTALVDLTNWQTSGRVGVIAADEGWSASFDWRQQQADYWIRISDPFGRSLVELVGKPRYVLLKERGKEALMAHSADALLEQQTGWTLPVDGCVTGLWVCRYPACRNSIQSIPKAIYPV